MVFAGLGSKYWKKQNNCIAKDWAALSLPAVSDNLFEPAKNLDEKRKDKLSPRQHC